MIETMISGLLGIFGWPAFGYLLIGSAIGLVIGLLPGIGPIPTLALMLPFIFDMTRTEAFVFVLSMFSVAATAGDITSVLFGIPGEGSAAAVILDGYPMAKKGEAGRALGIVLMASLVGAVFGAFVLGASIPIMRPLVLAFGSPELFILCVLGITFIATLGVSSLTKGIIMGGVGLLLATVGMDPHTGIVRYNVGTLYLWDGLPIVPVVIGLFALPEIIDLAVIRTSIAKVNVGKLGGVAEGVKDVFRHWALTLRCSALGALVGFIPGLGGSVAQWVAYGHAVQSSPNKERFQQGAIEGVIGPSAANNSKEGGALIPTVAFGVPGSSFMAILLGVFIIKGMVPGPDMLYKHLDVTWSMVWVIVVSNIIVVGVCLLFIDRLAKITFVKGTILVPFLLLLVFVGSFATHSSIGDLVTTIIFGVLGWIMEKLDWPRPALLLGLVLGGLTENYLWLSVRTSGASWLIRPIVVVVIMLIAGALFYSLRQERRERRSANQGPKAQSKWDIVFSAFILTVLVWAVFQARHWGIQAKLFPWVIGITTLILVVIHLVLGLRKAEQKQEKTAEGPVPEAWEVILPPAVIHARTLNIFAWIFGSFMGIWLLGFNIAMALVVFLYLKLVSREGWFLSIALAAVAIGFLYGLLDQVLHFIWPEGQLFRWFG